MRIVETLALALSGGSYKCQFQIYPLMFLEEMDIYPSDIFAISGGVPNMLGYVLKNTKRLAEAWVDVEPEKLYEFDYRKCLIEPLLKKRIPILNAPAIFKASKTLEAVIDRETDFEALFSSPIAAHVGVFDLLSCQVIWFSTKDPGMTPELFRKIVMASMRIPTFFPPLDIEIRGRTYQLADAGPVINLPVEKAVALGFEKIIAINSIPNEFLPISRLGIIPETENRSAEGKHLAELGNDVERIGRINRDLGVLTKSLDILSDPRIPEDIREELARVWQSFTFFRKRNISLCLLSPPKSLKIFQKKEGEMYGTPSAEARFELMGAGVTATELVLLPFSREQDLLTAKEEFSKIRQWRPAVEKMTASLVRYTLVNRMWREVHRQAAHFKDLFGVSPVKITGAALLLLLSLKTIFRKRSR